MTGSGTTTPGATRAVTIAVTSGKGGVGKTSVAINLAVALAQRRHRVAILDADFGLGNVDVLLGLAPAYHLGHLLAGQKSISEIIIPGPLGVEIIPASSGLRELTALNPLQWTRLNQALEALSTNLDFLLIDTAAGISDNVVELLKVAEYLLLVTSADPSAMVDAYALVKIMTLADPSKEIGIVVNAAHDTAEAELVYEQLDVAAARFLRRRLMFYGQVPLDSAVRDAILGQRTLVDHRPQSPASRAFRILATRVSALPSIRGGFDLMPAMAAPGEAPPAEGQPCA